MSVHVMRSLAGTLVVVALMCCASTMTRSTTAATAPAIDAPPSPQPLDAGYRLVARVPPPPPAPPRSAHPRHKERWCVLRISADCARDANACFTGPAMKCTCHDVYY